MPKARITLAANKFVFFAGRRAFGGTVVEVPTVKDAEGNDTFPLFSPSAMEWTTEPGQPVQTGDDMTDDERKVAIQTAVGRLDHTNDEHWTTAGLPAIDAIESFAGMDVTRKEVSELYPDFKRTNPEE